MKKGFELSLHAVVDLVLAAMAIIAVTLIITTVIFALYSEEENAQKSGLLNLVNSITQNEKAGVQTSMKPAIGYLKEDFVIIAFSEGQKEVKGVCKYNSLFDQVHSSPSILGSTGQKVELVAQRPDKCDPENNPACVCVCKFKKNPPYDAMANCVEGMCYPFREHKNLKFKGIGAECEIPLIYRNDNELYNYCIKWEGESIVFEPKPCAP